MAQFLDTPGLRVRIDGIPGVTRGDAAKALRAPYLFQCPPTEQLDIARTFSFNRRTTHKGKTRVVRGGPQPISFQMSTLAIEPGCAGFAVTDEHDVDEIVRRLERIHDAGWPFHLHVAHPYNRIAEISMHAVLEGVTKTIKAGEDDARYLSMQFSEWERDSVAVRTGKRPFPYSITLRKDGTYFVADDPERGTPRQIFNTKDEPLTLRVIAKYAYGKPSFAQHVAKAQSPPLKNWGSNEHLIKHPRFKKRGGKIFVPDPGVAAARMAPFGGKGVL